MGMAVASGVKNATFSKVSSAAPAWTAVRSIVATVIGGEGAEASGPPKLKHTKRARPI